MPLIFSVEKVEKENQGELDEPGPPVKMEVVRWWNIVSQQDH